MNNIWDIINVPMGFVIRFCNQIVGNNYIFALLLFALIIEILLLPFGIKQQKNSIKQAKLRPKEMAIRKKYAGRDDNVTKQKMNLEVQELYQKEGYNPMGGCLPLLIQLPIIFALYNIVMNPLRYICRLEDATIEQIKNIVSSATGKTNYDISRNIELLSDMKSMSYSDFANVEGFTAEMFENLPNLRIFGGFLDLGARPVDDIWSWLLLVPILTFLSYFFSMKMTRKLSYQPATTDQAMGCSNKMMDITMPLFSVFISFTLPAAMGVYWIFKSLLGVLKQYFLKLAMPIPTFTEEDYKAAEAEMNVKPERKGKSGRVVRSLHHIDDEDFADTAEAGKRRREALEAQEAEEAALREASMPKFLGGAKLKKDDKNDKKSKKDNTEDAPSEEKDNKTNDGE
ncbi:MAG: YidC/Oxa1 family membrane protein insertase [Ruminococcaceae bacterium]|nr:YidC/Oxa1 family membrane protein insertase [Oscillospiraceae bacterium]